MPFNNKFFSLLFLTLFLSQAVCRSGAPEAPPEENRFTRVVLDQNLNEPMELDLLDENHILFVERHGAVKLHDVEAGETRTIATLPVFSKLEEGLLGVAVAPDYAESHQVYFSYSATDASEIRIARFTLADGQLDLGSEQIILRVPVQRDQCCHVGGSLEFDGEGNLYLSVGDNSNPFASDGFNPIDEGPGRSPWDAQKSSSNANDLRGKILRIKPMEDGTYTIPAGNLFPEGTPGTRPEVYVMGDRNPYRIAIDRHTGYLYWGEVGPDAGEDGSGRGPRGYDEINQARQAGFFGWPYFIADNKAYNDYDYVTRTSGAPFDPASPRNDSPNNTGVNDLPPAQPAFIWYPYAASDVFPLVGEGGRTAMAGPVFYSADYQDRGNGFPAYFDGKLFIYEWMRGWVMVVTMDAGGDFVSMEPFMPSTPFHNPVDMLFGPDGNLFMLEYGTSWNTQNPDAHLSRIDFNRGNRNPVARITVDRQLGAAPLTVSFSGDTSEDFDGDALSYAWTVTPESGLSSTEPNPSFSFDTPGTYTAHLTVTDSDGASAEAQQVVLVGNDPPALTLTLSGNQSFFWVKTPVPYDVQVTDTEDGIYPGTLSPDRITVTFDFLPEGMDLTLSAQGHEAMLEASTFQIGRTLLEGSDCNACHQQEKTSIGPSFMTVADRYKDDKDAPDYLVDKIIKGGSGVWGTQAMAAHPQLTRAEVSQIVRYVLSLADTGEKPESAPPSGTWLPNPPADANPSGRFVLMATYADLGGGGIGSLTARSILSLRSPLVEAESFDEAVEAEAFTLPDNAPIGAGKQVVLGRNGSHIRFRDLDLTGIGAIEALIGTVPDFTTGGTVAVYLDTLAGSPLVSTPVDLGTEGPREQLLRLQIPPTSGRHDLLVSFSNPEAEGGLVCILDYLHFLRAQN